MKYFTIASIKSKTNQGLGIILCGSNIPGLSATISTTGASPLGLGISGISSSFGWSSLEPGNIQGNGDNSISCIR